MPTEKSTLPPTGRSPAGEAVPKPATRPARKFHWRVLAFGLLALAVLFVGLPRIIHALVRGAARCQDEAARDSCLACKYRLE
jgi:hypothetical protein